MVLVEFENCLGKREKIISQKISIFFLQTFMLMSFVEIQRKTNNKNNGKSFETIFVDW